MTPPDVPADRPVAPPSAAPRPPSPPLLAAVAVAGVLLAEVAWRLADGRLPTTDRAPLVWIADLHAALGGAELPLGALASTLAEPGGWLAVGAAASLRLVGRSPQAFDLLLVATWAIFVVGAARAAWGVATRWRARAPGSRVAPDAAAAIAALVTASLPWTVLAARDGGLAVVAGAPAALLLGAIAADPGLRRWGTVSAAAFGGAAALVPGAGGGVWAGLALGALLLEAIRLHRSAGAAEGPRYARLGLVLGAWAIGAVAPALVPEAPIAARQPPIPPRPAAEHLRDLVALVGAEGVAILLLSAIVALVAAARRLRGGPADVPAQPGRRGVVLRTAARLRDLPASEFLLVAAVAWPVLAAAVADVRPERLVAAAVPLGALAALALARHGWGLPVALLAWLAFVVPQHLDRALGSFARASVAAAGGPYRPLPFDVPGTLGALFDATCRSEEWRACRVVVDTSLLGPEAEDPGRLARFLLAEDRVALTTVYDARRTRVAEEGVDALLTFGCSVAADRALRRFPDAPMRVVELAGALGLAPAWSGPLGVEGCRAHWLVRGGAVAFPDRLPPAVDGPVWAPFAVLSALDAFYARNPSLRGREGRGTALAQNPAPGTPGWQDGDTAPTGWDAVAVARERARAR